MIGFRPLDSSGSEYVKVSLSGKHGNVPSASGDCGKFLDCLRDYDFPKKTLLH
jgi:hypothetical protein